MEDVKEPQKRKRTAYVTNKELLIEMAILKETGKVSDKLGKYIVMIATRYSNKSWFCAYTYKEDMISEAILTVLK